MTLVTKARSGRRIALAALEGRKADLFNVTDFRSRAALTARPAPMLVSTRRAQPDMAFAA